MEGGEGLIPLSSGFNSTLSEYHNTKLYSKGNLALLVSLPRLWMEKWVFKC